jgi:hypothetical protein
MKDDEINLHKNELTWSTGEEINPISSAAGA